MASKLVLPKENLFRAVHGIPVLDGDPAPALTFRDAASDDGGEGRTLVLQWAVTNRFTEIDSWFEGHFLERIAPGAFRKTISENRANMRILLEHGYDPQLGNKPIASIDTLEENDLGGYAEGRLFDGLDPLVVDGLRAGQYGSSFRFRVMREEIVDEPGTSAENPQGLPERTIKEAQVMEFGPVTWGAYSDASAGVRSITDEMVLGSLRRMPPERLQAVAEFWRSLDNTFAPSEDERQDDAETEERRDDEPDEARNSDIIEAPAKATPKVTKDYLAGDDAPPWYI